mmetsp:Transcript_82419/g.128661  ORF Transcript_82419/g.128661 Transcript_82419/m.128661 type:complete len:83 (+) Transcript_82419:40-288(+)
MHSQIEAAHDQMRVFYEMGREKLIQRGRISREEAQRFARIDTRLFALQADPVKLEFYQHPNQFHEDWIRKNFALESNDEEDE